MVNQDRELNYSDSRFCLIKRLSENAYICYNIGTKKHTRDIKKA